MTFGKLVVAAAMFLSLAANAAERVPFVGCASDGQTGPKDPPLGQPVEVPGGAGLAYYSDGFISVLAPTGWSCFGTYGSAGNQLYVAPTALSSEIVFSDKWPGITGEGIQVSHRFGDTSGRLDTAAIAARVFPSKRDYVQRIIDEGFLPASEFTFGPYPVDHLTYKTALTVEYETPANAKGLGTMSKLRPSQEPIRGVAMFVDEETGVFQLSARLPAHAQRLLPVVIQKFEKEHAA